MGLIYKNETVRRQVCTGFQFDRCDAVFEDDIIEQQEALFWENTGGYGSVWGDGTHVSVTLCQQCAADLFQEFAQIEHTE